MDLRDKNAYVRFKMNGCPACIDSQKGWDDMTRTIFNEYRNDPSKVITEIETEFLNDFKAKHKDGTEFTVSTFPHYAYFKDGVLFHTYDGAREGPELVDEIVKRLHLKPYKQGSKRGSITLVAKKNKKVKRKSTGKSKTKRSRLKATKRNNI